jgi:CHAD domain-containing protein
MDSRAPEIALPDVPAFAMAGRGGVLMTADGEIEDLDAEVAGRRIARDLPLVVCMPTVARRLGIRRFAAHDLLELFAFVRPAHFCLPTLDGLARAVSLAPAGKPPDPARLPEIAEVLLAELPQLGGEARTRAASLAQAMADGGWPWAVPVLKALGPARDLDVFLAETLPPVAAAHGEARGLKLLTEAAEARQAAAYEAVRALCAGRELSRLVVAVMLLAENMAGPGDWSEPLPAFAARVLDKRFRKARKKGRDFETMPTAQRHEVRIAVKKFRYALDFFQSLYPDGRIGTFRESLRALQDDLGRMNDATVAEGLAEDLAAGQPEAMVGAALVKGWYTHRLKAVEPHMIAAWNDFRATAPFWRE